jgi:uncharacterized protein YjaG (DUF416 family)
MDKNYHISLERITILNTSQKRMVYCYRIGRRFEHHYKAFCEAEEWGDIGVIQEAFKVIYDNIFSYKKHSELELCEISNKLEICTPNSLEYEFQGSVDLAQNGILMLSYCIDYIKDRDIKELSYVPSLAINILDSVINELDDPDRFISLDLDSVMKHPLMLNELKIQKNEFDILTDENFIISEELLNKVLW